MVALERIIRNPSLGQSSQEYGGGRLDTEPWLDLWVSVSQHLGKKPSMNGGGELGSPNTRKDPETCSVEVYAL